MRSVCIALALAHMASHAHGFKISSPFLRHAVTSNGNRQFTELRESINSDSEKKRVVVIGNGMVGQRFMENLISLDKDKKCILKLLAGTAATFLSPCLVLSFPPWLCYS